MHCWNLFTECALCNGRIVTLTEMDNVENNNPQPFPLGRAYNAYRDGRFTLGDAEPPDKGRVLTIIAGPEKDKLQLLQIFDLPCRVSWQKQEAES